jgi:uncharacterized protein (DUF1330 family)
MPNLASAHREMSAYIVATYTVTNPEGYETYTPGVIPALMAHGVEVLVADHGSTVVEGEPSKSMVVLKFADRDAAMAWYNSDEYQAVVNLRRDNSEGSMVLVDEFSMPG